MADKADIVIVGGGIWGLSTAWHLSTSGQAGRILLLERREQLADETTRQAAGQIGQLRADPLMVRAVSYTLDLYLNFLEQTGKDPAITQSGSIHLALQPARVAAFQKQLQSAKQLGLDVDEIDAGEIRRLAPAIDTEQVQSALYLPGDAYVDAKQAALALGASAKDNGVEIRTGVTVTDIQTNGDRATALVTSEGLVEFDQVVLTSGPWTTRLAREVGLHLPAQPIRLQQVRTVADPAVPTHHPVIRIPDKNAYLRPEAGGYLYGVFDEEPLAMDPDLDQLTSTISPPVEIMDEACRDLSQVMPILSQLEVAQRRQGMVTASPDGYYVLGPAAHLENVFVATACGAMGIAGSGAVGRWLSRWLTDGDPGDDLASMAPDRFGKQAEDRDWVRQRGRTVCANYYSLESDSPTYSIGAYKL